MGGKVDFWGSEVDGKIYGFKKSGVEIYERLFGLVYEF